MQIACVIQINNVRRQRASLPVLLRVVFIFVDNFVLEERLTSVFPRYVFLLMENLSNQQKQRDFRLLYPIRHSCFLSLLLITLQSRRGSTPGRSSAGYEPTPDARS